MSVNDLTKVKLTCSNVKFVVNGIISLVLAL